MREWPFEDFGRYLDQLMRVEGIKNDAELSRLSGIKQTQISNWRRGLARPAPESLDKLAAVLKVSSANLYALSGHLAEQHAAELDLLVLPKEFRSLIEVFNSDQLTDEDRTVLLRTVDALVSGLVANIQARPARPVKRATGRRGAA